MSRRELLGAAGSGLLLAGLAAGGGLAVARAQDSPAATGAPVRIGYLPITDAAPLLVAHREGMFATAGIELAPPVLFRSWASLAEAFLAGRVDVVHLLMPLALQLRFGLGADARVIAWNHVNGSALTVRPDIERVEQLAGGMLAIPAWWSIHNVIVQRMLRGHGLVPIIRATPVAARGEVGLVPMPPADMLPALAAGSIAGFAVAEPFGTLARLSGRGRTHRFLGDAWREHACCATVVRGDVLRGSPQRVAGFTRALVAAGLHCAAHRPEAAAALSAGYLPQPPDAIRQAMDTKPETPVTVRERPMWRGERIAFRPYPQPSFTERLVEEMRATRVDAPAAFLDGLDGARAHRELVETGPLDALPDELATRIDRRARREELT